MEGNSSGGLTTGVLSIGRQFNGCFMRWSV